MDPGIIIQEATSFGVLDPSALSLILHNYGISAEVTKILESEQVCGSSFLLLRENDMKEMQIKLGPRKLLLEIIKNITANKTVESPVEKEESDNLQNSLLENSPSSSLIISDTSSTINQPPNKPSAANNVPSTSSLSRPDESFNVREILTHHIQGKELIATLEGNETLSISQRKLLVRIVTGKLIDAGGYYPPNDMKVKLAESIVTEFPCLKSQRSANGYEHFYDIVDKTGLIEYRLKTVRTSLTPSKKKYCTKVGGKKRKLNLDESAESSCEGLKMDLLPENELIQNINWMKLNVPTSANREGIKTSLIETYPNRRQFLLKGGGFACDVIQEYPRLLSYHGEMIDLEFSQEHDTDVFSTYPKISKKILDYAEFSRWDLTILVKPMKDEHMKSICILTALLPGPNYKKDKGKKVFKRDPQERLQKKDKIFPPEELIKFKPVGSKIEWEGSQSTQLQPSLICIGDVNEGNFFVVIDKKTIPVGDSFLKAFDILFKTHFVFNVKYAQKLEIFYNFIETVVYKLPIKQKTSVEVLEIALK